MDVGVVDKEVMIGMPAIVCTVMECAHLCAGRDAQ